MPITTTRLGWIGATVQCVTRSCGHKWTAVYHAGTTELVCPRCNGKTKFKVIE